MADFQNARTEVVEGVILAAGLSTRMGSPKLRLEINGVSLLARVVRETLASKLHRVILVVGPGHLPDIGDFGQRELREGRLHLTVNQRPEEGMASSLRQGMEAVDTGASGVMVILADQPGLTASVINRLLDSFLRLPEKIVAPCVKGRRTTPVIFPAGLFVQLMRETGDVGGRNVVNGNLDKLVQIDMGSHYDDADVDTPADLNELRRRNLGRRT